MASQGYPVKYDKGFEIHIPQELRPNVYVAGAALDHDRLLTSGGRVLGVTMVRKTLREAVDASYAAVSKISFQNAYYRHDIGKRALSKKES